MRYVIELPLRAVDVEPSPTPLGLAGAPGAAPSLQDLRVMSIDDREDALDALKALLEVEGALVLPFTSGHDALAWLEANDSAEWPQVVICDIALGEEDGHHVIRQIRHLEARRGVPLDQRLPAIALTGLAQPGDRVRSLMAGFQVHLAKPVDPRELVTTLYTLSGRAGGEPAADASFQPTGTSR